MKEVRRNAKNFGDRLERQGLMPFGRKIVTPDPDTFISIRGKSKYPEFVTKYTADELSKEGWQLMQIEGLDAVAALTPEMDLVNVVNASGLKDIGEELVVEAIRRGAKTLDAYKGHLTDVYYPRFGFVKTGRREKFNPAFADPNWNYEKFKTPDIVYMELDPNFVPRRGGEVDVPSFRRQIFGPKVPWERQGTLDFAGESREIAPGGGGGLGTGEPRAPIIRSEVYRRPEHLVSPGLLDLLSATPGGQ